ncbi:MAG: TolC family protein [Phycisphaerales bacterium]|nr:TolC family protein [Phycisphaerales bacterium]MCI0629611.1 TolC family protein [Phycisphaerales bacterium]MCI0676909.1 TolC family protein [Phycisphaerales bacterium]
MPPQPTWQDVLHRAFLANGDLEAAYFDWKAAVERIGIASAYPNSNVELGYSYMFSSERMNSFDRMTFSVGFDAMENLAWPSKVKQAGKVALDEARVAGERFRAAKFLLQQRVLTALADYSVLWERARIERDNLMLLRLTRETATGRVQTGAAQHELLRAGIDVQTAEDRVKTLESELEAARTLVNGMLTRDPQAPLEPSNLFATPRVSSQDDLSILLAAADRNPEIARWVWQVEGRQDALELARMQWIPDITPSVMFTGGVAQVIGAAISLPTTIAEIRGSIRESQAMLRASEATLRQVRYDSAAAIVATLVSLRNNERQAQVFRQSILPLATQIVMNVRESYSAGSSGFIDLIEAQRTLLEVQLTIVEAEARRQRRLAELESLLGIDLETLDAQQMPSIDPGAEVELTSSSTASAVEANHHD